MDFYKISEDSSHRFYKTPKYLNLNPCYRFNLTSDAKMIYSMFLDRMELSRKNGWINSDGEIYLKFTKRDISYLLGISESTIYRSCTALEEFNLIRQERQGQNKANNIYIGKVDYGFRFDCSKCKKLKSMECPYADCKNKERIDFTKEYCSLTYSKEELEALDPRATRICQCDRSGPFNLTGPDLSNRQTNETEGIDTDFSETENNNRGDVDNSNPSSESQLGSSIKSKTVVVSPPAAKTSKPKTEIDLSTLIHEIDTADINVPVSILKENIRSQDKLDTAFLWVSYIADNRDDIRYPGGFFRKAVEEGWDPEQQRKKLEDQKQKEQIDQREQEEKQKRKKEQADFDTWCDNQPKSVISEAQNYAEQRAKDELPPELWKKGGPVVEGVIEGHKKQYLKKRYKPQNAPRKYP